MCPPPEPAGQSGGVLIPGTIDAIGGDLVGRDSVVVRGNYIGDKSHEQLVETLRMELVERNKQISLLQESNQKLSRRLDELNGAFAYVRTIVGGPIRLNDYIVTSILFLHQRKLHLKYWESVPEEARKAGAQDD